MEVQSNWRPPGAYLVPLICGYIQRGRHQVGADSEEGEHYANISEWGSFPGLVG